MGVYVSAALANEFELSALFLLCPALSLEGYERVDYTPRTDKIVLVHGWNDDVVPVESYIQFAREHKAMLHLLPDNHRLSGSISHLVILLESLLKSLIESEN